MAGYLIAETTREEEGRRLLQNPLEILRRTATVVWQGWLRCIGEYIDGKKELRQINMEFNARYVKSEDMPVRSRCPESFC